MTRVNHAAVGQRIRALRTERRLSQAEAAVMLGLKQNAISNLETGHTKLSLELAVIIAEMFEVSVDELVVKQGARAEAASRGQAGATVVPAVRGVGGV
ncbi:MAG: hypothetical protein ETSY1_46595, partial (plasmid) [Candidatus Entotheonella factor]